MSTAERLKAWIKASELTQAEMASRCDMDRGNFNKIVHGIMRPSLPVALRIEQETNGSIRMADWVEQVAA